jgi:hypothetical protein
MLPQVKMNVHMRRNPRLSQQRDDSRFFTYVITGAIARILPDSLSRTTVMSSLRVDRKKRRQEADFGFVEGFGGEECF